MPTYIMGEGEFRQGGQVKLTMNYAAGFSSASAPSSPFLLLANSAVRGPPKLLKNFINESINFCSKPPNPFSMKNAFKSSIMSSLTTNWTDNQIVWLN